ncbi:hypothetical protein GCM10027048_38650 [Hymenobacter coalescens]
MRFIPTPNCLLSFLLALLLLPAVALAQRTVSGRVTALSTQEALPQVTVRVEGQPTSVVTDKNGRFSLTLPAEGLSLTFSHVGYQPLTVPADKLGADVALEEQRYLIGEVQVSYVQLRKLLLKEWRIEPASLGAAAQNILTRLRAMDPKKADYLAGNPDAVRKVLEMARYEFRENGIVKTKLLIAGHKLRWQLDEENRTLTLVSDERGERQIQVVELTDSRLVLKSQGDANSAVAYIPAD